jgi:hypothetical protein
MNCQHEHTETTDDLQVYTTESGPEFEIFSTTCCLDCGAEIEVPTFDVLAVDCEPTMYELELEDIVF